jgi:hypothetical protein
MAGIPGPRYSLADEVRVAHRPLWVKGSRDALKDGCPDYPPIADIGELSVRGSRKPACAKSILAPPDPSGGRMVLRTSKRPTGRNLFCPGCLIIAAARQT